MGKSWEIIGESTTNKGFNGNIPHEKWKFIAGKIMGKYRKSSVNVVFFMGNSFKNKGLCSQPCLIPGGYKQYKPYKPFPI